MNTYIKYVNNIYIYMYIPLQKGVDSALKYREPLKGLPLSHPC